MVDYGGRVQGCRMNAADHEIANQMITEGLVTFRRLPFAYIESQRKKIDPFTHVVVLSEDAWQLAHQFRRARAVREQERAHSILGPI